MIAVPRALSHSKAAPKSQALVRCCVCELSDELRAGTYRPQTVRGLRLQPIDGRTTDNVDDTHVLGKQEFEWELTAETETDARGSVISIYSGSSLSVPSFLFAVRWERKVRQKIWGQISSVDCEYAPTIFALAAWQGDLVSAANVYLSAVEVTIPRLEKVPASTALQHRLSQRRAATVRKRTDASVKRPSVSQSRSLECQSKAVTSAGNHDSIHLP